LDTNVYSRPFDDQTRSVIQTEADALLTIIEAVKAEQLSLLSSDILFFEVHKILNEEKRTKVLEYLTYARIILKARPRFSTSESRSKPDVTRELGMLCILHQRSSEMPVIVFPAITR
jgi:hypothetical protein